MASTWKPTASASAKATVAATAAATAITPKSVSPTYYTPTVSATYKAQQANNAVSSVGGGGYYTPSVQSQYARCGSKLPY